MSRAVLRCWRLGSPDALRKVVEDMPRRRASAVINSAKPDSVPPIASPNAAATSLAERVTSA